MYKSYYIYQYMRREHDTYYILVYSIMYVHIIVKIYTCSYNTLSDMEDCTNMSGKEFQERPSIGESLSKIILLPKIFLVNSIHHCKHPSCSDNKTSICCLFFSRRPSEISRFIIAIIINAI